MRKPASTRASTATGSSARRMKTSRSWVHDVRPWTIDAMPPMKRYGTSARCSPSHARWNAATKSSWLTPVRARSSCTPCGVPVSRERATPGGPRPVLHIRPDRAGCAGQITWWPCAGSAGGLPEPEQVPFTVLEVGGEAHLADRCLLLDRRPTARLDLGERGVDVVDVDRDDRSIDVRLPREHAAV